MSSVYQIYLYLLPPVYLFTIETGLPVYLLVPVGTCLETGWYLSVPASPYLFPGSGLYLQGG